MQQRTSPFRPALDNLVPYEPGRPVELVQRELGVEGPLIKLASNEGAFAPMPAALEAIARAAADGNRYPDGGSYVLRATLAERHDVPFEQVVVGNGADAILNYLSLAMLEPGDEAAFCWPSFVVYHIDTAKMGATPVHAPLRGSAYDLDALLEAVGERTKIVYVTNPNNPTGGMVRRDELARFLDALPDHVLPVIDEAYHEYVDDPDYPDALAEHAAVGRRVMVVRTFSKIYGLAGFRVGWAVAPVDVAAACLKVKNAFDVAQAAQDAAVASLGDAAELARRRASARAGRVQLADGLAQLGSRPLDAVANFVCVEVGDAAATAAALERLGVIVRPLAGFGDPASIRVTAGLPEENAAFLEAFARVR